MGDLDNDGRLDALMVAQNEPTVYFHNRTVHGRHAFRHVPARRHEVEPRRRRCRGRRSLREARRQVAQRLEGRASSRRAITGSISDWDQRRESSRSTCGGLPEQWIRSTISRPTGAICSRRAPGASALGRRSSVERIEHNERQELKNESAQRGYLRGTWNTGCRKINVCKLV